MEDLGKVVDALTESTHALRRVIRRGADDGQQLELFEQEFADTERKFNEFKEYTLRSDKQAAGLLDRYRHEVTHQHKNAEILRQQIEQLKVDIAKQEVENGQHERDINASIEELARVKKQNNFMRSPHQDKNFIQRLTSD